MIYTASIFGGTSTYEGYFERWCRKCGGAIIYFGECLYVFLFISMAGYESKILAVV
jgi:hypothetical protein